MDELKIGKLILAHKTILAPMASLTDIVFRRVVDEIGGIGLMVTELISAEGLRRKQRRTLEMVRTFEFKTPQFIQLFGSEPDPFVESAKFIENETDYCGIDINMGCPARKVVRKGAGAALLADPIKIAKLCKAVKKNVSLPLSVKIRLGFEEENLYEVLKVLEGEGVDAVAIHFRMRSENYSGPAKWEFAKGLRENFKPVLIGNGDIKSKSDAMDKLRMVDGVMIGRAAIRNPFIFSAIAENDPGIPNKSEVTERILDLVEEYYPPEYRLLRIKAFTKYLVMGKPHIKKIRYKIYSSKTFNGVKKYFRELDF